MKKQDEDLVEWGKHVLIGKNKYYTTQEWIRTIRAHQDSHKTIATVAQETFIAVMEVLDEKTI